MVKKLAAILFFLITSISVGQVYYIDSASSSGDGTTTELTGPNAAWKNLYNIMGVQPGDTVLFRRDCSWTNSLQINVSGEPNNIITYGAYGQGEDPLIDVSIPISERSAIYMTGVDYFEVKNFRLIGSGRNAAFYIFHSPSKGGSGAMGDGFTVTVRDVNVISNTRADEGSDGFSLTARYQEDSSQVLFYDITASKCRSSSEQGPYGSNQCLTLHASCKAKVYGADFSDSVSWYAGTHASQIEFYNLNAESSMTTGIVIAKDATSDNYCLISDSNLTVDAGGKLCSVLSGASLDSQGITIQDSFISSFNGAPSSNYGNLSLLRNFIEINDPGWKFTQQRGKLRLEDNVFVLSDTTIWASVFRVITPGYVHAKGNLFNIESLDYSVFNFKKDQDERYDSIIANNIFKNVSNCDSVVLVQNDAYAPMLYNNVFYNSQPGGIAIENHQDADATEDMLLHFENNIFQNIQKVLDGSGDAPYTSGYNCFYNSEFIDGLGSFQADPMFADVDSNDFHLKSEGWRLDGSDGWTWDDVTSRCIDAGNPGLPLEDEMLAVPDDPNNDWGINIRTNIGAYGRTSEASMAPYQWSLLGDISNDGITGLEDISIMAGLWMSETSGLPGDLNRDEVINLDDFQLMGDHWGEETLWAD